MYAGEAEKQLSSLAQVNQQLANEQYNKKMQALQLYNALTNTGDERRGSALKDATRSGIIGMGANVVDLLRGDNGNDKLKITNSLGMPQPETIDRQPVVVDKLGPQGLNTMSPEQAKVDAYNIDKQKRAEQKAMKEQQAQERKDPIGGFLNYAKDKGLNIPTQFEGSKDDQRKQNYDLHNAQIEYFMSKGRRDLARKAESEWIQNEINIDKSWGDNGKANYSSLWNTSGPKGDKMVDIGFQAEYGDNNLQPARNERVPQRIYDKGSDAVRRYLNKRDNAQIPITNLNLVKPVGSESKISPESLEYNKGMQNMSQYLATKDTNEVFDIADKSYFKDSSGRARLISDKNKVKLEEKDGKTYASIIGK